MTKFLRTSLMRTVPPARSGAAWARLRLSTALASAILLSSATTAVAVPVLAEVVGCTGGLLGTCTVEPIGGPVDVDPLGFTLEVTWGPEHSLHPGPRRRDPKRLDEALLQLHRHTRGNSSISATSRFWMRAATRFSTRMSVSTT